MSAKKGGRPSKYEPRHLEEAERLAMLGLTDKQMAEFWGIAESTLNLWKTEHPEFSESLKAGKAQADAKVARSLFERATGYEHEDTHFSAYEGVVTATPTIKRYPPDTTAGIFWLKNRQPEYWREKIEVQHGGTDQLLEALAAAGERARNVRRD